MKPVFWCTGVLLLITVSAQSQQSKSNTAKNKQAVHSKNISTSKATNSTTVNKANTITLSSSSDNAAKTNENSLSSLNNNYVVTDPILTTLNARANGANIQFNKSGIVGMPKRAYGFANGHITLATTGAVTSGTQTGSGAVATGTSLATFGSIGTSMNVNGKSPYAGINMWGNAMNLTIIKRDSAVRLNPVKKQ